jgi:hypothetical protein
VSRVTVWKHERILNSISCRSEGIAATQPHLHTRAHSSDFSHVDEAQDVIFVHTLLCIINEDGSMRHSCEHEVPLLERIIMKNAPFALQTGLRLNGVERAALHVAH